MEDLEETFCYVQELIEREQSFNDGSVERSTVIEMLKISATMCLVNKLNDIIDCLDDMDQTIRLHE